MENKKSFVLYSDLIHTVEKLPDDKAGQLFKIILEYVNDNDPFTDDLILSISFEPIKQQLKRDLDKWANEKKGRSHNGRLGNLKRWSPDLHKQVIDNQISLEEAETIANDRKASPPDSPLSPPIANVAVNDSVTVTVNASDTVIKKEKGFDIFWSKYPNKVGKKKTREKFLKLSDSKVEKVLDTIDDFIAYKPFKDYTHPNPDTYLRNARWDDEIPKAKVLDPRFFNKNGDPTF